MHDALSSPCLLLARVTGALSCLCGHWPDQSPVSLCPQTLGACAPRPCARALPAKYPVIHFDINQNISEPFMPAVPPPHDSRLFSRSEFASICQPRPRCRDGDRFQGGALGSRDLALAITRFSKILRDAGQLRLNWPQAPAALRTRPCHATQARDSECPM